MKKAFAIFAAYYRRIAAGRIGKFIASIGKGEHRTLNAERRTPNENDAAPSVPVDPTNASAQDHALLAPRLSGERNEVRGADKTQHSTTNIEHSTSNEEPAVHSVSALRTASPALERRPNPGSAAVSASASDAPQRGLQTRISDLQSPPSDSRSSISELRAPISDLPNFITRDELKRELESLRRLIESRK